MSARRIARWLRDGLDAAGWLGLALGAGLVALMALQAVKQ